MRVIGWRIESLQGSCGLGWILPPLSKSWIITLKWFYIALTGTPNIDCYWVGAVPKVYGLGSRAYRNGEDNLAPVGRGLFPVFLVTP